MVIKLVVVLLAQVSALAASWPLRWSAIGLR